MVANQERANFLSLYPTINKQTNLDEVNVRGRVSFGFKFGEFGPQIKIKYNDKCGSTDCSRLWSKKTVCVYFDEGERCDSSFKLHQYQKQISRSSVCSLIMCGFSSRHLVVHWLASESYFADFLSTPIILSCDLYSMCRYSFFLLCVSRSIVRFWLRVCHTVLSFQ